MNISDKNGFTLVEVIVAMALFIVVIIISGNSFNAILTQASRLQRSEESNIEGVVGLEIFRHDLQQAGLGLFNVPPPMDYIEALVSPAQSYNDSGGSPTFNVPRPLVFGDNQVTGTVGSISDDGSNNYNVLNGTDYVVIKATTVGSSKTAQKWAHILPVPGGAAPSTWPSNAENFTDSGERFVVLRRSFTNPPTTSIEKNVSDNTLWFKINSPAFGAYSTQSNAILTGYGFVSSISDENKVHFPFNRTDYFVAIPQDATKVPPMCAPNTTGILYKTTVNHADGKLKYLPILDCVADMQVVLGWDTNNDGLVDTWSNADGSLTSGPGNAQAALSQTNNNDNNSLATLNIRNNLKMIKIYLIVQNGKKDPNYISPDTIPMGDPGENNLIHPGGGPTAVFTLSSNMKNYRWKEYRIIVRPKNLLANQ